MAFRASIPRRSNRSATFGTSRSTAIKSRFRRTIEEAHPFLPGVDGDALAIERSVRECGCRRRVRRLSRGARTDPGIPVETVAAAARADGRVRGLRRRHRAQPPRTTCAATISSTWPDCSGCSARSKPCRHSARRVSASLSSSMRRRPSQSSRRESPATKAARRVR